MNIPLFRDQFSSLDDFLATLIDAYHAENINSWDDFEPRVMEFFTPEQMEQMEACIPGWKKMSSYNDGVTLTHVMCVFLGLSMLPEYAKLTPAQQTLMKWTVLFHDIEKVVEKGKRDPKHGFRSAVTAARTLPALGFETTSAYNDSIQAWSAFTHAAITTSEGATEPIQDNQKLPEICAGIDQLFGNNSSSALIVKTILLHMSINVVKEWPQAAPLSHTEIREFVDRDFLPLLECMMLADNEGWVMFYPEASDVQRYETLEAFEAIRDMIS